MLRISLFRVNTQTETFVLLITCIVDDTAQNDAKHEILIKSCFSS